MSTLSGKSRNSKKFAAGAVAVVTAFFLLVVGLITGLEALAHQFEKNGVMGESTVATEPMYILLIGNDSRKETALYTGKAKDHAQVDQHSDIVTLMRVDPTSYTVTLVTVPRDTYLEDRGCKLSDTLVKGDPQETVAAVEEITGVRINYYMMTTFNGFRDLIDNIGGIVVDVPKTISTDDPVTAKNVKVTAGNDQVLDGSEALVLARARKEYGEQQDAIRQSNVRNIEESMIDTVLYREMDTAELLLTLEHTTTTNMSPSLISYMITDFIAHREDITLYSCTGPYDGDINGADIWVVDYDPDTWSYLMSVVDAGGDPSGIVVEPELAK